MPPGLPLLPRISKSEGKTHHEGHKATVPATPALVIISGPHDLDAGNVPVAQELLLQHLLIHCGSQIAHIQVGGVGVSIIKATHAIVCCRAQLEAGALLPPSPLPFRPCILVPVRPATPRSAVSTPFASNSQMQSAVLPVHAHSKGVYSPTRQPSPSSTLKGKQSAAGLLYDLTEHSAKLLRECITSEHSSKRAGQYINAELFLKTDMQPNRLCPHLGIATLYMRSNEPSLTHWPGRHTDKISCQ